jgi:Galactose oxidase, central domain/Kelch motif
MMRLRFAVFLVVALTTGACGSAATTPVTTPSAVPSAPLVWQWRPLVPNGGELPTARSQGTAIYDPVGRRLVIFGGSGPSSLQNDVWAFDTSTLSWARLRTEGVAPEPRLGANAVYDPNGHQMVLWAGQQGSRFFNDTWTLDLRTYRWHDVSPDVRPQARYGSASVFDPAERSLVQFAGFTDQSRRFQDTQSFDLDTLRWADLTPSDAIPQVRCLHTAALHASSRRMIVYGGQRSGPLDDLWAFDLGTRRWAELTPAMRPAARMLAVSFVDRAGRFVVFGGRTGTGAVNETWAFDLESRVWSRLEAANAPPPRDSAMGASADDGERFLVFGGSGDGLLSDLWELRLVAGAS